MVKDKRLMVLLVLAAMTTSVMAIELDVDLSADFLSRYVWRGQNAGQTAVVQPSATISKAGFSFNVWGNMPLADVTSSPPTDIGRRFTYNEIDYTIDYTGDVPGMDILDFSAGFILYTYPSNGGNFSSPSAHEIYLGVVVDTFLNPSLTIYRGTNDTTNTGTGTMNNGWYINAAISHSMPLLEGDIPVGLEANASLGWGDSNYNNYAWTGGTGTPGSGLNDLVLGIRFPMEIKGFSVVPQVSYITLVENKIRSRNPYVGSDLFVSGISVSKKF